MKIKVALSCFLLVGVSAFAQAQTTDSMSTDDLKALKERMALQNDIITLQQQQANLQKSPSADSVLKDQTATAKDIAEAKQAIAEAEVKRMQALIGTINTANLPKGDSTLTGVDIQATIMGYKKLKAAIDAIVAREEFCANTPAGVKPVVVMDASILDDITMLRAYEQSLNALLLQITKLKKGPQPGVKDSSRFAPAVAFAAIDAAVALSSLFKTDTTMTGVSITADARVARYLFQNAIGPDCHVIDPNDYHGPTIGTSTIATSVGTVTTEMSNLNEQASKAKSSMLSSKTDELTKLKAKIADIKDTSSKLQAAQAKLDAVPAPSTSARKTLLDTISEAKKKLKDLGSQDDAQAKIAPLQGEVDELNAWIDAVSKLDANVTRVTTAVSKIGDDGQPFLTRLMKAEAIDIRATEDRVYLTLLVSKLGGNNINKKHAFGSTKISFGGGAVVQYQLRDASGLTVIASGQEEAYSYVDEKLLETR